MWKKQFVNATSDTKVRQSKTRQLITYELHAIQYFCVSHRTQRNEI